MMQEEEYSGSEVLEALNLLKDTPPRDAKAVVRGKEHFIREARLLRENAPTSIFQRLYSWTSFDQKGLTQMNRTVSNLALFAILAVFMTALFGGGVVSAYASRGSLPGDTLFPVKTALEDAQVAFNPDAARDAELHMVFAQRRLDEMASLVSEGRYESLQRSAELFEEHIQLAIQSLGVVAANDPEKAQELAFSITEALSRYSSVLAELRTAVPEMARAAIEHAIKASRLGDDVIEYTAVVDWIGAGAWSVGGLTFAVTVETEVDEGIAAGDTVTVEAVESGDGSLFAIEIELVEKAFDANENDNVGLDENINDNVGLDENVNENEGLDEEANDNVGLDENVNDNVGLDENVNDNVGLDDNANDNVGQEDNTNTGAANDNSDDDHDDAADQNTNDNANESGGDDGDENENSGNDND